MGIRRERAVFRGGTGEGAVCGFVGDGQIVGLKLVAQRLHNATGSDGCGCGVGVAPPA